MRARHGAAAAGVAGGLLGRLAARCADRLVASARRRPDRRSASAASRGERPVPQSRPDPEAADAHRPQHAAEHRRRALRRPDPRRTRRRPGADRPAGPAQAARARQSRSGRRRCRDGGPGRRHHRLARCRDGAARRAEGCRPEAGHAARPKSGLAASPGASRVLLRPGAGARGGGRSGAIRAAAGIRRPSPGRARSARARDSHPARAGSPW